MHKERVPCVIMVNKNTLGIKKVAWPRKTAGVTKRTDIGMWPRFMQSQYTQDEIVRPQSEYNTGRSFFNMNWKIYELNLMNKSHKND